MEDGILVPLVKQGQSLHQIYLNHKDELMCRKKTLYRYVEALIGSKGGKVLPKGKSFDNLAQRLGCHEVAAKDTNLTPGLLKK